MSVDVLSAIYGNYETPKVPVKQKGVEVRRWILVTDNPDLVAPGWDVVVERRPHVHPNVAAKVPKFRPALYSDALFTVWIDGHALIQPTLVKHCVDTLVYANRSMGMFPHPQRIHLMDEVVASRGLPKYDDLDLEKQVQHYLDQGYPDDQLWASGCIAREHKGRAEGWHEAIGSMWLNEVLRWGFQDQLSLPYVLWAQEKRDQVVPLGPDLWSTPHLGWTGHG